ncbi:MAG TPA: hypothetical protein VG325_09415 [Solirubrobacteraceae bacterium]|jgi:hypothetical protein|nr:hypothetical protein [Solirubrobacteraceae bacterium]
MRSGRSVLRPAVVVVALVAALALPATAFAGGFTARLVVSTHQPRVGLWPVTVTATRGRHKLSGDVYYRFLYNGTVVKSYESGGRFRNGVYHDKLNWPKQAVGHTITLQVVVQTKYGTDYLDWWIKVRP